MGIIRVYKPTYNCGAPSCMNFHQQLTQLLTLGIVHEIIPPASLGIPHDLGTTIGNQPAFRHDSPGGTRALRCFAVHGRGGG